MTSKIKGVASLLAKFDSIGKEVSENGQDIMDKEVEAIKNQSVKNAPIDEGNLEKAHTIEKQTTPGQTIWKIKVGGTVNGVDVDKYALRQHEDPSLNPGPKTAAKYSGTGRKRQFKFLEDAAKERKQQTIQAVKAAIRKGLK